MNNNLKSLLPHVLIVVVFAIITLVFFGPLFQGKEIRQGDVRNFKGMSKEIVDYREATGEEPLWTNSMFSGMPAFQISVLYHNNLVKYVDKILTVGLPPIAGIFFMYMLGFYILMCVLRLNPWIGMIGAIAFAFSSYFIIIIEAGHNTKAHAIAYMAPVFAGVILAYRGRLLLGMALTALFLALEIYTNHLQITYYLALTIGIYIIAEFITAIREHRLNVFGKATAFLAIAAIIAVGVNAGNLMTTMDYTKYTTRGKSELTIKPDGTPNEVKTSGLDKDYATAWSYGTGETMSFLIPAFKGNGSGALGQNKDNLKDVDPQMRQAVAQMDSYWGDQSFTSGPVYIGAIIMFLAVLGLFIVKGPLKWALFIATVFSVLLGWGKNFMPLTDFFLDYFPGYNKFRTVSMILVIAEFTLPVLAALALNEIVKNRNLLAEKIKLLGKEIDKKKLVIAAFVLTGGIALMFFLAPGMAKLEKANEVGMVASQITSGNPEVTDAQAIEYVEKIMPDVIKVRKGILKADAGRSFVFILLAAILVWIYLRTKMDHRILLGAIALLVLIDMWSVDTRYLNKDNYVTKRENVLFPMTAATEAILKDKDPNHRVLNIAANTFNDAGTSYYHKSIGGYHGAKLERYQEMIEFYIAGDINSIYNTLRTAPTDSGIRVTLAQQGTLNMLNTKYIIYNESAPPIQNRYALGNAWFIGDIKSVKTADEEIMQTGKIDPATTAIINEEFKEKLSGFAPKDAGGTIGLKSYKPNHLVYESNAQAEQLAVFSEIYYPGGWNAYVDGKATDHFRANYILRAMRVPAGKHTIEFKFEPKSYHTGETVSLASSIALILLLLGVAFAEFRKSKQAA